MQHLLDAVRRSVREKNWYAALAGALTLPDIAAYLDQRPGGRSRFISWCEDYLTPTYTTTLAGVQHVFLSGKDCYALRCAYLHSGDFDITAQDAQDVLSRFEFLAQESGMICHRNQYTNLQTSVSVLQLQVCNFCEEVCEAVERWLAARATDPAVAAALAQLPLIHMTPQIGVQLTPPVPPS
jgi:hypothetical protein